MIGLIRLFKTILPSLLVLLVSRSGFSQTNNPCGVVASISPSAADSVVPVNTIVLFTNTSINATSVSWLYDGFPYPSTSDSFYYQVTTGVHLISLVAYRDNCTDTMTVVYFSAGTPHDVDSLLLAHYGTYRYNEEATCIDKTPDGDLIVGGVQYLWGNECGGGEAGVMVKIKDKGCVDWSRKLMSPYFCTDSKITKICASADSNYYVATENIELAKLDKNGNILWNRRYVFGSGGYLTYSNMCGDPQGNIYIAATAAYNNGWVLVKLDNNGNVVWNKFLRLSYSMPGGPGQSEFAVPSGIVWLNGKVFVCGNAYSGANSTYFSFLTKIDAANGTKEWQSGYTDPNYPGASLFAHLTLYDTLLLAASAAQGQIVTLLDASGTVRKNIKTSFSTNYNPRAIKAGADNRGHIYVMEWTEESLPLQPYYWYSNSFAEIDTSLNKYWGAVFEEYQRPNFVDATISGDNKFSAVGYHFGLVDDAHAGSRDIRLLKVDTVRSDLFCYGYDTTFTIGLEPINQLNFNYLVDSALTITIGPATPYFVVDANFQARYNCPDFIDSCSFMKITGPKNLCSLSDVYTYRLHRNRKCVLTPQWNLPPGITVVSQTDSTLSIRFSDFGVYRISATLNSCIPVKDSLIISIFSRSHPLNLGSDTTICAGTIIRLHASTNFLAYQWNDGSTDSVLNVTQPGLYWIQVIDSCNNHLRDSVTIAPFYFSIDIGPDRIKCNNDTIHLNGPAGFLSYEWSNNYNISSTTNQNVIVNPSIDTTYFLKAEKLPGCFSYDTVRIKVNTSPPVTLGPDKSFCRGDSALLSAGAGFAQYQWSDGSLAPQITVYSTGNYSVIAMTAAGCKSYDTLRVINVWSNPTVTLDHNPTLCMGDTRVLNAGNFNSYLWQDGSTGSSFAVTGPGIYYVTAWDNNQCKGSDTVHVTTMLALPTGFLPSDTTMCNYGTLQLTPTRSFSVYLWNNNSISSSISITTPGLYWLKVTDANDCTGRDSIVVNPKECLKGFYVPTAFTPDRNGRNDDFKPFIGGRVKRYEFIIYNRWGQVIFSTRDVNRGWDGSLAGVQQESNVFAWVCSYQLEGENMRIEKGTVLLIR